MGGLIKQYEVHPDLGAHARLQGDAGAAVRRRSQRGNANAGGSYVEQGRQQYLIRGIGLFRGPTTSRNVVVAERNGTPVLVKDIAEGRRSARCRARASSARTTTTTS